MSQTIKLTLIVSNGNMPTCSMIPAQEPIQHENKND